MSKGRDSAVVNPWAKVPNLRGFQASRRFGPTRRQQIQIWRVLDLFACKQQPLDRLYLPVTRLVAVTFFTKRAPQKAGARFEKGKYLGGRDRRWWSDRREDWRHHWKVYSITRSTFFFHQIPLSTSIHYKSSSFLFIYTPSPALIKYLSTVFNSKHLLPSYGANSFWRRLETLPLPKQICLAKYIAISSPSPVSRIPNSFS